MNKKTIVAGCIALAAAGSAQAQWMQNLYVGGAVGPSKMNFKSDTLTISGGPASTLTKNDESGTAVKAYLGYRLNPYFGGEIGIVDYGSFTATRSLNAPANGSVRSEIDVFGVYFDAVGFVPLGGSVDLFAKLGVLASNTYADRTLSGSVSVSGNEDGSHSESNLHAALGAQFSVTRRIAVRLEYERAFKVGNGATGEGDVSALFIGANWRF
jgi:opacity protein-like surface antigen